MSSLFDKVHSKVHALGSDVVQRVSQASGRETKHSHTHAGASCDHGLHDDYDHRYGSFAPQRTGNDTKWYVDGCDYMWAVSRALESASESIWILDWWLSPELYLRRPPSRHEAYRLDRVLHAAARRGVKVNIIVYKEVTQALTRKYLTPTLPGYLHSLLPHATDPILSGLSSLGLAATFASLEAIEAQNPLMAPPLTVCSSHTKHALEDLHPNICVFRHPDHLPDATTLQSSLISSVQNLSLTTATAAKLPGNALQAIYGMSDGMILYWAHHEKLCLIDGTIAFMGGLDLCYGRWDTNDHPIADAHPGNLDDIVFPGQDFNNARIMDFQDVNKWQDNKLDRKTSSRMGWSDISLCLRGPVVEDLRSHFVDRWNFMYDEKYQVRKDVRYSKLHLREHSFGILPSSDAAGPKPYDQQQGDPNLAYGTDYQNRGRPDNGSSPGRGRSSERHRHHWQGEEGGFRDSLLDKVSDTVHRATSQYDEHRFQQHGYSQGVVPCQIVRSCAKWSHGSATEHSIANAYISIIENSQHFIYIENQFFITATDPAQRPIQNKIGAAIVARILRAARAGQKYKVIVVMPAVPAFAGDLKDDASLGTRAIMEFQYFSINRGGHSIMESIGREGFDPTQYIRFYNLRNYDRVNSSAAMTEAEQRSGVSYEDARRQHDDVVGAGFGGLGEGTGAGGHGQSGQYQQYQQHAQEIGSREGLGDGRWDSVSECYMLGGPDIRRAPWQDGVTNEMDAFVSEELYVHSKLMIADDCVAICGSANLNDRSQLGDHDSEIAIVIEDPTPLDSRMNGQPWRATKFAATLRRQVMRKHLGLLPAENMERPTPNFEPVGVDNVYDFGSREDEAVVDPLSDGFQNFWNITARRNTQVFDRIFHPVPSDAVKNWKDYDEFYAKYFTPPVKATKDQPGVPAKYQWGHVVAEQFPPGNDGVREVKELLSTVRGTLVEMPLLFLIEEDIAKEGMGLNAFTESVYT
ncbi:MAG: hypothetical protein M1817_003560 [Caeruleum heppii]|nr:MAG: hypothetical protein M1817_003560 [Caeruleum heppii]